MASIHLNDGETIPWLAIGTGTAAYGRDAKDRALLALRSGITHLDGAQMYANEDSLGAAVAEYLASTGVPRSALFITTKLGDLPAGQSVVESLKGSLEKLQLDYVDLFLVHTPFKHEDLVGVWKGMQECQKAGLAKTIGVSNFRVAELEKVIAAGGAVPAINQIEYHPYVLEKAEPIVAFCKEHKIVVESYGGLTPVIRRTDGPLNPIVASIRERLEKEKGSPVTEGQVLLKWVLQQGIVVVTTTAKAERIHEYQAVLDLPELTADEIKAVADTGRPIHHRVYVKRIDEA